MDTLYSKILSLEELNFKLRDFRDKKISLCNGCFDIKKVSKYSLDC